MNLTDFMCVCSPDSKAKAEACLERVVAELGGKCKKHRSYKAVMSPRVDCQDCARMYRARHSILTSVVFALEWGLPEGFRASIDGIGCDMWCGVSVQVQSYNEGLKKYEDHADIYV